MDAALEWLHTHGSAKLGAAVMLREDLRDRSAGNGGADTLAQLLEQLTFLIYLFFSKIFGMIYSYLVFSDVHLACILFFYTRHVLTFGLPPPLHAINIYMVLPNALFIMTSILIRAAIQ